MVSAGVSIYQGGSVGDVLTAFASGAINGAIATALPGPLGWILGGAASNLFTGLVGGMNVDDLVRHTAMGGITGFAGGYLGALAGPAVNGIVNPALRNIAGSALGGMLSGGVTALLTGGDFWEGVAIGGATGLAGAGISQVAAKWLNGKPAAKKPTQETKQIDIAKPEMQILPDLSAEIANRGHTQLLLVEKNPGTAQTSGNAGGIVGNNKIATGDGLNGKVKIHGPDGFDFDEGKFIDKVYFRGSYELKGSVLHFEIDHFGRIMNQKGGMRRTVAKAEEIAIRLGAKEVNIQFNTVINPDIYNNQVVPKGATQPVIQNWAGHHGYKFSGGGHEGSTVIWKKIF